MKKAIQSIAAVFLLLLPMQAAADDIDLYVAAGLGAYAVGPGNGVDTNFGGYGLIGVDVMPNLGLEVRVGKSAEGSNLSGKFGTDYFVSYMARPHVHFGEVNLYGLVGASTINAWYTPTAGTKTNKVKTSFSIGAGIEYMFAKDYLIGIEAVAMDFKNRAGVTPYDGSFVGAVNVTLRVY